MGFCTDDEVEEFFRTVPEFEQMLVRSGIVLVKYWFSITDDEQQFRFIMRINDPLKQWKLSPMDVESRRRWEEYTKAKEAMLELTSIPEAPWWVVEAVDKKRARLNCISHLLSRIPYQEVDSRPGDAARARAQSGIHPPPRAARDVCSGRLLSGRSPGAFSARTGKPPLASDRVLSEPWAAGPRLCRIARRTAWGMERPL